MCSSRSRASSASRKSRACADGEALVTSAPPPAFAFGFATTAARSVPVRCWAHSADLEPAGRAGIVPSRCHTAVQDILALLIERGRLGRDHELGRHEHQYPQPIIGRLSTTIDQIAPQLGPTFDGLTRLSRQLTTAVKPSTRC